MAKIFISHSSQDKAEAVQLMQWLEGKGFESLFLDSDARHGIKAGSEWEKTLYREIRRADAFLFLLSENWLDSQWCGFEFMAARMLGKSIFPLRIQAGLETNIARDIQHLDLSKDREDALQRLLAELTELTLNIQQRFAWDKTRPPYPGMLAFEAEDAPVFFGRDAEINRLRERLNQLRTQGGDSLLVMLAASGAGKSSLLKAGLLPRLRSDARHWIVLEALRPEQEPLRKLAQVLATACGAPADAETLYAQLQGGQALDALRERLRQLRARSAQWEATVLLSIDQAEELFSTAQPAETTQLLQLLTQAQTERLPLLTLMAMRGDYLEALQAAADKPPFSPYTLDPLPLERVSDLIRGPAAVVGLAVEDGLITAATNDAATADALPLLAFALRELYERFGTEGDLTLDEYRRLGSDTLSPLENAVQHKASEAIQPERLGAEALQALRDAFIPHMVRVNDAGDYVRQPALWGDLPAQAQPLLDQLTSARLLVQCSDNGAKRVEVAHEALLRHWRLLNGWLREEHDFLLGKQQLEHSLRDWQQLPEPQRAKGLLQGIALERAREWLLTNRAGLSEAERDYIHQSHQADEDKRKAEEQKRKRNQYRLIGLSLLLAVVAGGAAWQAYEANQQRLIALENEKRSTENFRAGLDVISTTINGVLHSLSNTKGISLETQEMIASKMLESSRILLKNDPSFYPSSVQMQFSQNEIDASIALIKIYVKMGKLDKAKTLASTTIQKVEEFRTDSYNLFQHRPGLLALADIYRTIGAGISSEQGNDPTALEFLNNAVNISERGLEYYSNFSDANDFKYSSYQSNQSLSIFYLASRQPVLAKQPARRALELIEKLYLSQNQENNSIYIGDYGLALLTYGDSLFNSGAHDEAEEYFRKALSLVEKASREQPSNLDLLRRKTLVMERIGSIFTLRNKLQQAEKQFERILELKNELVASEPNNTIYQQDVAIITRKLRSIRDRLTTERRH